MKKFMSCNARREDQQREGEGRAGLTINNSVRLGTFWNGRYSMYRFRISLWQSSTQVLVGWGASGGGHGVLWKVNTISGEGVI